MSVLRFLTSHEPLAGTTVDVVKLEFLNGTVLGDDTAAIPLADFQSSVALTVYDAFQQRVLGSAAAFTCSATTPPGAGHVNVVGGFGYVNVSTGQATFPGLVISGRTSQQYRYTVGQWVVLGGACVVL